MIRLFKLLLPVVAGTMLAGCGNGRPGYGVIETPTGKWRLVWNDEFRYEGLPDPSKWNYDTRWNDVGWGNNEDQFYTDSNPENSRVDGERLVITALRKDMGGKKYTSARLTTKGKGDWRYGRVEVRAMIPAGRGAWSAIWMLPSAGEYGTWPASGEIDIMENVGSEPGRVVATVHTERFNHLTGTQKSGEAHDMSIYGRFHDYALEWEEDEMRIYFDDVLCFTYRNDGEGPECWPFDRDFHLILNLAVGGNWGGNKGIDDTVFPTAMQVDYVRVYEKIE